MNNFLLDILAIGAVFSGILVITAKNPVISVLFLISVFINVAGYLVLMGVAYLGLVYIIVYVGAIAILFLFVVMMINIRQSEVVEVGSQYTKSFPIAITLGGLFFFEILSIAPVSGIFNIGLLGIYNNINSMLLGTGVNIASQEVYTSFNTMTPDTFYTFLQIESIGQGLYTYSTLWLIIASIILLLSIVGPIILCLPTTSR